MAGPNGLVPYTLVFGTQPAFPIAPRSNPTQMTRFAALRSAREEMAQIICERRLNEASRRKLPESTSYLLKPSDKVRVYRESSKAWDGPFFITKTDRKVVTVTDGVKAKNFNISQIRPASTTVPDPATKR